QRTLSVIDSGLYLPSVANDPAVRHKSPDVLFCIFGDACNIKIMKGRAEILALLEYGAPAKARLEPFKAQLFEQATVIPDRKAPLFVVVSAVRGGCQTPDTSQKAVGASMTCFHPFL